MFVELPESRNNFREVRNLLNNVIYKSRSAKDEFLFFKVFRQLSKYFLQIIWKFKKIFRHLPKYLFKIK